jgi:hypothetical protein
MAIIMPHGKQSFNVMGRKECCKFQAPNPKQESMAESSDQSHQCKMILSTPQAFHDALIAQPAISNLKSQIKALTPVLSRSTPGVPGEGESGMPWDRFFCSSIATADAVLA